MIIEVVSEITPEFITCPICGQTKFKTTDIMGADREFICEVCDSIIQVD